MATKVTLSSPPVQHSKATDDAMDHELPGETQYNHPSGNASPPNYATKRPPTPPKSKQPTLPSWKQNRTLKHNENTSHDRRSPEPFQSTNMNSSSGNSSNSNKHTKNHKYHYHPQTSTENDNDYLQHPPPLLQKKSPGHLDEFFILQEQMDLTCRHRDQIMEENGLLKYHLHVSQQRLQAMESMWYDYYYISRKKRASWAPPHSQHLLPPPPPPPPQQQQQQRYRPSFQSDYLAESFTPLIPPYLLAPSLYSHLNTTNRLVPEQHDKDNDDMRQRRFRRQRRSKSLPRDTSFSSMPSEKISDMSHHPLYHQTSMFPPPPPQPPQPIPSMFRPIPPPLSSRPPLFGRYPPQLQQTRKCIHPSSMNKGSNINTTDESASESVDDLEDGDNLHSSSLPSQRNRHPRHHRYMADKSPRRSPSYPPFRHHTADFPMGPPPPFMTDAPLDDLYGFDPVNDDDDGDDDDGDDDDDNGRWKNGAAPSRYYDIGGGQQQHRYDRFNKYPRQIFYDDSQHHQQQQSYTLSQRQPPQYGSRAA